MAIHSSSGGHPAPDPAVLAKFPRFGQLALLDGLVAESDLVRATALQAQSGGRLGDILLQCGYLSAGQVGYLRVRLGTELGSKPAVPRKVQIQGRQMLSQGLASPVMIAMAMRAWAIHKAEGREVSLAAVSAELKHITAFQQVKLETQGTALLHCARCDRNYQVEGYAPGYRICCLACRQPLTPLPEGHDADAAEELFFDRDRADELNRFGTLALLRGFATREQLMEAARVQAQHASDEHIGQVLVRLGFMKPEGKESLDQEIQASDDDLEQKRRAKLQRMAFGEIALKRGFLNIPLLRQSLNSQLATRKRGENVMLGALMEDDRALTRYQVLQVLANQGKRLARCPTCAALYNAAVELPLPACPNDQAVLVPVTEPEALEVVADLCPNPRARSTAKIARHPGGETAPPPVVSAPTPPPKPVTPTSAVQAELPRWPVDPVAPKPAVQAELPRWPVDPAPAAKPAVQAELPRWPVDPAAATPAVPAAPVAPVVQAELPRWPVDPVAAKPAAPVVQAELPRWPVDPASVAPAVQAELPRWPVDPAATKPAVQAELPRWPVDPAATKPAVQAELPRWPVDPVAAKPAVQAELPRWPVDPVAAKPVVPAVLPLAVPPSPLVSPSAITVIVPGPRHAPAESESATPTVIIPPPGAPGTRSVPLAGGIRPPSRPVAALLHPAALGPLPVRPTITPSRGVPTSFVDEIDATMSPVPTRPGDPMIPLPSALMPGDESWAPFDTEQALDDGLLEFDEAVTIKFACIQCDKRLRQQVISMDGRGRCPRCRAPVLRVEPLDAHLLEIVCRCGTIVGGDDARCPKCRARIYRRRQREGVQPLASIPALDAMSVNQLVGLDDSEAAVHIGDESSLLRVIDLSLDVGGGVAESSRAALVALYESLDAAESDVASSTSPPVRPAPDPTRLPLIDLAGQASSTVRFTAPALPRRAASAPAGRSWVWIIVAGAAALGLAVVVLPRLVVRKPAAVETKAPGSERTRDEVVAFEALAPGDLIVLQGEVPWGERFVVREQKQQAFALRTPDGRTWWIVDAAGEWSFHALASRVDPSSQNSAFHVEVVGRLIRSTAVLPPAGLDVAATVFLAERWNRLTEPPAAAYLRRLDAVNPAR